MSITFKRMTPTLLVDDVDQTLEYYYSVLGFKPVASTPDSSLHDEEPEWAMVWRDGIALLFRNRLAMQELYPEIKIMHGCRATALYVGLKGVEELYHELQHKGAQIAKRLHTTPTGSNEFSILDCNGYVITFAEPPSTD